MAHATDATVGLKPSHESLLSRLRPPAAMRTPIIASVLYCIFARGAVGGMVDGSNDTFSVAIGPSPLILLVIWLAAGLAHWTKGARHVPWWVQPGSDLAVVLVPLAAVVATFVWIVGSAVGPHPGDVLVGPWWAVTELSYD